MNNASPDPNATTPSHDADDARHEIVANRQTRKSPPSDVLDLEELHNRCMGNLALVERILEKFQQRIPEELAALEQALEQGDTEQVARVAHRVKGSSASVSAKRLERAAAALDALGREGRASELPGHVECLRDEWARCRRAIIAE